MNDFENLWSKIPEVDFLLEAKLNLLHKCLTPLEKKEAEKAYKELIELLDSKEEKKKIVAAYDGMKEIMEIKNVDCFSDKYITVLENLRKSLEPY